MWYFGGRVNVVYLCILIHQRLQVNLRIDELLRCVNSAHVRNIDGLN
jgi:hypothetical protein